MQDKDVPEVGAASESNQREGLMACFRVALSDKLLAEKEGCALSKILHHPHLPPGKRKTSSSDIFKSSSLGD